MGLRTPGPGLGPGLPKEPSAVGNCKTQVPSTAAWARPHPLGGLETEKEPRIPRIPTNGRRGARSPSLRLGLLFVSIRGIRGSCPPHPRRPDRLRLPYNEPPRVHGPVGVEGGADAIGDGVIGAGLAPDSEAVLPVGRAS